MMGSPFLALAFGKVMSLIVDCKLLGGVVLKRILIYTDVSVDSEEIFDVLLKASLKLEQLAWPRHSGSQSIASSA